MTMPAVAPSTSTRSMSSDRGAVGKIIGHLYIAAKTLLEGHVSSMDEVRHEIRSIMVSGNFGKHLELADEDAGDGDSVLDWTKLVTRMIRALSKIPQDSASLPDSFKKELARSIRQGKKLCGGGGPASGEAQTQIKKASQLYRQLSGPSYL